MGIIKNNPTINKPVNTRNTAVQVRGVRRCVKIQHRTRTCITRLGNTAALPVPVLHPTSAKATGIVASLWPSQVLAVSTSHIVPFFGTQIFQGVVYSSATE
jgi:hypothetical protein